MPESFNPPTVSVVIRNYNRADRLRNAVDSVLVQTWADWELVFVDDASSDDSVAVARQHYGHLPNFNLVECAINGGAGAAANVGVEMAQGEFVAFLDSDDVWFPNFLQAHMDAFRGNPRGVMSYCDYVLVWEGLGFERVRRCNWSQDQRRDFLMGGFVHTQSMTVTRREAILQAGGFEARYQISHDFFLWLSIALMVDQPFLYVDCPLLRHSISADGVTTRFQRWQAEYMECLERAYTHPAAEPYLELREGALAKVSDNVFGRQQVSEWLTKGADLRVSIILRTRNRLPYLVRAVESVKQQTYRNFELIIVDDGSSDETPGWLQALELPDLRVLRLGSHAGPAAALNAGARLAEGTLLAFLDDDDEWLPEYLETQVRANSFVINPPLFTYTDYYLKRPDLPAPRRVEHRPDYSTSDVVYAQLVEPCPHSLSFMVTRRETFFQAGGVDDALRVGYRQALMPRLAGGQENPRYTNSARYAPVHVRRPLGVRCMGLEDHGIDEYRQASTENVHHIYQDFFDSPEGANYRFLAPEIIEGFLRRTREELQELQEAMQLMGG